MPNKKISLYAPSGEFGCLSIYAGPLTVTVGFVWAMRGFDITWRDRIILTTHPF